MGTSASAERRESTRKRFSGTVELALPDEAEGYEADAVDLSIGGMSLKTAFLPDVGSELDCRFVLDGSDARTVQARGQVVWAKDNGNDAGTFGLCFTDVSKGDRVALEHHCEPRPAAKAPADAHAKAASAEPAKAAVDPHAKTVNAQMPVPATDDRVRLRLPKMGEPLKARVHQEADGALVVGMDLSFIALGDHVEVESAKGKSKGVLEDVSVDVDPKTRGARLVLTVSLDGSTAASRTGKHSAIVAPSAAARPAPVAPKDDARVAKKAAPIVAEDSNETDHDTINEPAPRGTGTEVLSSRDGSARAEAIKSASASDSDEQPSSLASRSSAPAWLVSALSRVKIQGKAAWDKASPAIQQAFAALVTLAMTFTAKVRAKVTGKPVELPAPATAATRATTAKAATAQGRPTLRKQNKGSPEAPSVEASAIDSSAPSMRRKYAMIGLGAFGLSAIVFALATGGREPRPQAPRPQVAVEASGAAPTNSTAQANPSANEAPAAAGGATTGEPESNSAIEPSAQPASRPGAMPSDLVAAARSRNANVDSEQPTVRREAPALTIAPRAARPAAAAPVVAAAGNLRPLGSPAVRSGTTLRLRVDGPITQLSGGAAGANTLTFTMPGRHAIDRAAAFVRMDPRIAGAGAFNRGGNTEFTLRFHGAAPAFNARARGDVLEVVLAAPSATAAAAPRPAAHGVRVASMPRR